MYIHVMIGKARQCVIAGAGLISSLPDQSPNLHMLALAESFSTHQIGCAMKISCYSNCRGLHITVGVYQISSDLIS